VCDRALYIGNIENFILCAKQVHLIDATFVWTEPHSKRIKLKLIVQKEVIMLFLF